jgi:hypothetical protein
MIYKIDKIYLVNPENPVNLRTKSYSIYTV